MMCNIISWLSLFTSNNFFSEIAKGKERATPLSANRKSFEPQLPKTILATNNSDIFVLKTQPSEM